MGDLTFKIVFTKNLLCISFCDWNVEVCNEMKVHWHAISGATYNFILFVFCIESKGWNLKLHFADFEGLGCSFYEANDKQSGKICGAQRLWFDNFR